MNRRHSLPMGTDRRSNVVRETDVEKADRRGYFLTLAGAFYDFTAELLDSFAERLASTRSPAITARLLCKSELAAALGVSIATIDRDQAIPFVIVGDSRRYDLAAVLAALAEKSTPVKAPAAPPAGVRLLSRGGQ